MVFWMLLYQGIWRKYIFARASAISHDGAKWKVHQLHFHLSRAFRMTVRKFRMVMRNSKTCFSTSLCNFSHFFIFNPPPPPSIQLQSLVQTNYITSFIVYLAHHQLYLFSSIWFISFGTNLSKSYLEMTPKLHKTC